ncbi:MAG: 2-oxoglutarate dehydrogenase, E2 component, dihydrolipoamide succinyltransferase, partial [Candidatus Nanopelagicales bacterium]|nr:2-oxoglutarate dehydrogenase, E2 component, dihydrolipoamide succinyltransferase [Candidatus Nanopelagicales bacterium]
PTAGGPPPAGSAPDAGPATDTSPAYVTPLVRKLAADHGVDLGSVVGTGIGGRIRRQDVLAAAGVGSQQPTTASPGQTGARVQRPPSRPAPTTPDAPKPTAADLRGRTEKMSNLRRLIAERMVESLQVSAQLTTVSEVDLSRIAALRSRVKERFESHEGVKLSYLPFFAKAAVEALKSHPSLNASVDMAEGEITYHDFEHLGIAVDTKRGLLAPVIRDAGDLNIAGLARHIANLAERTRTNRVSPDELSGATFTLTNTGSRGSLIDTPIINQPQVAILATGAVVKRPVVVQGSDGGDLMAIRSMAYLALTYDHRVIDGADAARFMSAIKRRLEEGEFEGELGL